MLWTRTKTILFSWSLNYRGSIPCDLRMRDSSLSFSTHLHLSINQIVFSGEELLIVVGRYMRPQSTCLKGKKEKKKRKLCDSGNKPPVTEFHCASPCLQAMVSKLIDWFLWAATRHVPSIFLFSMTAEWLRLLAWYDYSICIMMLRTCCCYNLFPLFCSLCLTQHIAQWLLAKTLVMDNLPFSLLSWYSFSLPFCLCWCLV